MNTMRGFFTATATLALALSALACGGGTPAAVTPAAATPSPPAPPATGLPPSTVEGALPAAGRLLGFDPTEDVTGDFDAGLALAQSAGMGSVSLSVQWDALETAPGEFAPDPNWLAVANDYYAAAGLPLLLMVGPVDTNQLRLPDDLRGRAFDDPVVIARYKTLLDWVKTQLPDVTVHGLALGNEVDLYLTDDADQWNAYAQFFAEASDHARTLWPDVPVGVKATLGGIVRDHPAEIAALNAHADMILVTYYPFASGFTVAQPEVVHADFAAITTAYPDKPVWFAEIGYPSSADNGSSEALQATFVHEAFAAWDTHRDQIRLLHWLWLHDLDPATVAELETYYGLSNRAFAEYLRTLGLRRYDGSAKPAWDALVQEAAARGF